MNNKISSEELYKKNINKLIEISQIIDEDNEYNDKIKNDSIFLKLLFKDLRNGYKWYDENQWRPIKVCIHNCYKLLQTGYKESNQKELESNIIILEKLIKEYNPKKDRLQKLSESVIQNIFDNTLKILQKKVETQENIRKSFDNMPSNVINEFNNFEKGKNIPKELINKVINKDDNNENNNNNNNDILKHENINENNNKINNLDEINVNKQYIDNKLNEQKIFYENKINKLENKINNLENEINKLKNFINNIGGLLLNYNKDQNNI
jgi:cob(I)alamin adenosyltransferase